MNNCALNLHGCIMLLLTDTHIIVFTALQNYESCIAVKGCCAESLRQCDPKARWPSMALWGKSAGAPRSLLPWIKAALPPRCKEPEPELHTLTRACRRCRLIMRRPPASPGSDLCWADLGDGTISQVMTCRITDHSGLRTN